MNGRVHEDQGFVRRWMKALGMGLWLKWTRRQDCEPEETGEKSRSHWCLCDGPRMDVGEDKAQRVRGRKDARLNWRECERWDRKDGDRRSEGCEDAVAVVVVVVVGRRSH